MMRSETTNDLSMVELLINNITVLRINKKPGKSYLDYAKAQLFDTRNHECLSDADMLSLSSQFSTDHYLQKIIIASTILSQESLLQLLATQKFDPDLCTEAMDSYASQNFVRELLEVLPKSSNAYYQVAAHAMKSSYVDMLEKNKITKKTGYHVSVCKAGGECISDIFNTNLIEMAVL